VNNIWMSKQFKTLKFWNYWNVTDVVICWLTNTTHLPVPTVEVPMDQRFLLSLQQGTESMVTEWLQICTQET
jgi:hypothetical protein